MLLDIRLFGCKMNLLVIGAKMAEDNSSFLNYVNSSGFAFQMRIEEEILKGQNRWQFAGREHRWQDENGRDGYIDLLIDFGTLRAIIECKKQKDKNWVFLKRKNSRQQSKCSLLWAKKYKPVNQMPFPADFIAWDVFDVSPMAYASAFCTLQGQGDNSKPLLERTASELTHAAECLAKEELAFSITKDFPRHNHRMYMPIIVTNAKLTICSFIPNNVDLATGELSLENATFETVPYIRFRKGLQTNILSSKIQIGDRRELELRQINAEKERTVFVVNSENLLDFLKECNIVPNNDEMEFPWIAVDQIYYNLSNN